MSADAPDHQGHDQHPWDVRSIRPTALARVEHPLLPNNRPSLKRWLWHLKGASAICARRQRLLLLVGGCSGPPGTRPAPFGRSLHLFQGAWTCGAPLTHQKPPYAETVSKALVGRVSHLPPKAEAAAACRRKLSTPRDPTSTLWTFAASVPRRFHVWRTLTHEKLAFP